MAEAWVFHAGALGDFVTVWPLIRAMTRDRYIVHVVADAEKASLAAACIAQTGAVVAHGVQQGVFTRMWRGEGQPNSGSVSVVIDGVSGGSAAWLAGARAMFPGARMLTLGPPGSEERAALWHAFDVHTKGGVEAAAETDDTVVCHVGAGGESKRWPMACWCELSQRARRAGLGCAMVAGEVEADRLTPTERDAFASMAGRVCVSLDELVRIARTARVFVGADTGPTHLAAQLGVTTLSLFGPTDPRVWAPVGPRVRVLAPESPRAMSWLGAELVGDTMMSMLGDRA